MKSVRAEIQALRPQRTAHVKTSLSFASDPFLFLLCPLPNQKKTYYLSIFKNMRVCAPPKPPFCSNSCQSRKSRTTIDTGVPKRASGSVCGPENRALISTLASRSLHFVASSKRQGHCTCKKRPPPLPPRSLFELTLSPLMRTHSYGEVFRESARGRGLTARRIPRGSQRAP